MKSIPALRLAARLLAGAAVLALGGCDSEDDSTPSGSGTILPQRYKITFYYTPVESFFSGPLQPVAGCTSTDCASGSQDLGAHPADFLAAV